ISAPPRRPARRRPRPPPAPGHNSPATRAVPARRAPRPPARRCPARMAGSRPHRAPRNVRSCDWPCPVRRIKIAAMEDADPFAPEGRPLRRGWTTGACATAATKAALAALLQGAFEDPVTITLPGGQTPAFALAHERRGPAFAEAGIIKDAGDDPDVTHGALVFSNVTAGVAGSGVTFHAGEGVGTVTKPGLPLGVGEPAINPVPRRMMREVVEAACAARNLPPDFQVTIS